MSQPVNDSQFASFFLDPLFARVLNPIYGIAMLQKSFEPVPIIKSSIRGFPIRWICEKLPLATAGSGARRTRVRWRAVVAQAPMVALGLVAGSSVPVLVNIVIGTSMAIVFTL